MVGLVLKSSLECALMFSVATSFFARTAISQSYIIGQPSASRSSTPGPSSSSSQSPPLSQSAYQQSSIRIGLWKVHPAVHKTTSKRVSVWSFDKRGAELERLGPAARERVIEVLKSEASSLSRLRHPCILEMVEPIEETRTELVFATEPVLSSLEGSIPGASRNPLVELDEIEIRKGVIQICKGLSFLHTSAQIIHSNLSPESVMINSAGDWKLSGLGLTIPLLTTGGTPTRWEFPTFDGHIPSYVQRSFDYMAPEYALDEVLATASDMYSLGCLIYAVHSKGSPPFRNHGSLSSLREHAGNHVPGLSSLDPDLRTLISSLITRRPANRLAATTVSSHSFFSSLAISTLNFLDRSNFTTKTREEKISFMKGLIGVLDKFSERLQTRKILPSLLEEMKDAHLLPYILPNVFAISKSLNAAEFASQVLPSLKPLFAIKEPPQNMLTLLDNLEMLQSKTDKVVFREQVLPLVYSALASEHSVVQERGLRTIPSLCETVDYAEVQGPMFYNVACVFQQTKLLSVKVATLVTFLALVKTLDQAILTQKMVPLLSKIRTKEPAVMMATLSVQELLGAKVDRESVATLVLPQLWSMSIGPLLNVEQFERFMSVIQKLGTRVHKEHNQFLRDSQRIEDRSAVSTQNVPLAVDFQSLVVGSNGSAAVPAAPVPGGSTSWDDDVWGSVLGDQNIVSTPNHTSSQVATPVNRSLPSPMRSTSFSTLASGPSNAAYSSPLSTMTPMSSTVKSSSPSPNYSMAPGTFHLQGHSTPPPTTLSPQSNLNPASTITPATLLTPTMGTMLTPSKTGQSLSNKSKVIHNWDDFDPLA